MLPAGFFIQNTNKYRITAIQFKVMIPVSDNATFDRPSNWQNHRGSVPIVYLK